MLKSTIDILVNGKRIDIDGDTAIGLSYKGFDFQEPGSFNLNYSNNFTVPLTNVNRDIFAFPDDMGVNSMVVEQKLYSDYDFKLYIDGAFSFSGKLYVSNVSNSRIYLYCISHKDFTQTMSDVTMFDSAGIALDRINSDIVSKSKNVSFPAIIEYLSSGTEMAWIPYIVNFLNRTYPYAKINDNVVSCSNMYDDAEKRDNETDAQFEERKNSYDLSNETVLTTELCTDTPVVGDYKTGSVYFSLKTVIEETFGRYGYSITFDEDILSTLNNQYVRMPDICIWEDLLSGKFVLRNDSHSHYKIGDDCKPSTKEMKFLDLFKTMLHEVCGVFSIDEERNITVHSLNTIMSLEPEVFDSLNVTNRQMNIDGVPQNSWIAYSDLSDGSVLTGGLEIKCMNRNIDKGGTENILFSIGRYLTSYLVYMYTDSDQIESETMAMNNTDTNINSKFVIVQRMPNDTPYDVKVQRILSGIHTSYTDAKLYRAYNLTISDTNYWNIFAQNCMYPECISVDCRVTAQQVTHFSPYNIARFRTIPGLWYITEIQSYNPRLENGTTTVKAVRIRE